MALRKTDDVKEKRISIRVTESELAAIHKLAEEADMTMAEFVISKILTKENK